MVYIMDNIDIFSVFINKLLLSVETFVFRVRFDVPSPISRSLSSLVSSSSMGSSMVRVYDERFETKRWFLSLLFSEISMFR